MTIEKTLTISTILLFTLSLSGVAEPKTPPHASDLLSLTPLIEGISKLTDKNSIHIAQDTYKEDKLYWQELLIVHLDGSGIHYTSKFRTTSDPSQVHFSLHIDRTGIYSSVEAEHKTWIPFKDDLSPHQIRIMSLLSKVLVSTDAHLGGFLKMIKEQLNDLDQSTVEGRSQASVLARALAERADLCDKRGAISIPYNGGVLTYDVGPSGIIANIYYEKNGETVTSLKTTLSDALMTIPKSSIGESESGKKRKRFGMVLGAENSEIIVQIVFEGSPADRSGVKEGMRLISINDVFEGLHNTDYLQSLLDGIETGLFTFKTIDPEQKPLTIFLKKE